MLDFIGIPFGYLIEFCYKLVPNYAVALIIFAFVVKLVLFPVGIKQQKNMVKQASLRPKEQAIRNRYSNKANQQKLQDELMKLYQEENYSPYGGCLPMIVQLVVILAVYQVMLNPLRYINHVANDNINNIKYHICELYNSNELVTEGLSSSTLTSIETYAAKVAEDSEYSASKISIQAIDVVRIIKINGVDVFKGEDMLDEDFSADELTNFNLFGDTFDLSETPSLSNPSVYWVMPILVFVFTFGSMKITKKFSYQAPTATNTDANTQLSLKIMDYVMPLISTVFTFQVPTVVALYWIYQNIFSTVQQIVLKFMYPYPEFSEEEYKAASRELYKGKTERLEKKKSERKASAHRIDLDDDEIPSEGTEEKTEVTSEAEPVNEEDKIIPREKMKD